MGTPLQGRFKSKGTDWSGSGNITRSAWFDGSADYLTRSMGTPDDQSKWIVSLWFRRTRFGTAEYLFQGGTSASAATWNIGFEADDQLASVAGAVGLTTTRMFRDSEWTHLVFSYDSDDSTAGDRCKMWINGVEETSFTVDGNPSSGAVYNMNASGQSHQIGAQLTGPANQFKGKIAQVLFLDGESIQDSSHVIGDFGEYVTVGDNGSVWAAKKDAIMAGYAGTADGNSFCLSTDIGDGTDDSGNSNTFTATSMSDSANGSADTPTTPSPVFSPLHKSAVTATLSEGGQRAELASGAAWLALTTLVPPTGKYYVEFLANTVNSSGMAVGVCNPFAEQDASPRSSGFLQWEADGDRYLDGSQSATEVSSWSATNVVGLGINMDDKQLLFYDNAGNLDATVAFGANVDGANGVLVYLATVTGVQNATVKIKSAELSHGLPTGYSTLEPANFPEPAVQGVDVFNPLLYTGNAGDNRGITGAGFKPDLIWLKKRSASLSHKLVDSTRGIGKILAADATSAEATETWLDSFDTDGFTIDNANSANDNTATYVGWLFKANGGTTASNASGDITSTVQASEFFSVVTWTGNATVDQDIGHGLGSTNISVFLKNRSDSTNWVVSLCGMASTQYLGLDGADAASTASDYFKRDDFTTTTFRIGNHNNINGSSDNMLAYCFKNTPGVCMAGTYVGNGSTDGPVINTGFSGRWIIIKSAGATGWVCFDTARDTIQPLTHYVYIDAADAEAASGFTIDALANGFKIRDTHSYLNSAGTVYHYISVADVASGTGLPPILGK